VTHAGASRTRLPRRRARITAVVAGVMVAVAVVVGILWATVLPGLVLDLSARVDQSETKLTVGDQEAPVTVAVPAGWERKWTPLRGDDAIVTSPDGVLTISITATAVDAEQAFAEASREAGGLSGALTEVLGSGMTVRHARSGDDALIAAVGTHDGSRSAIVVARAGDEQIEPYLPAVGQILDGLSVSS
jgi:hypothetical protein